MLLVDSRCRALLNGCERELDAAGITLIGYNGAHGLDLDYEALIAGAAIAWRPELTGDDLALYSYTSGTTGTPKGVMLSQDGVSSVILHSLISLGLLRDDIWYMPGSSALAIVIMALFGLGNGMTIVIPDGNFTVERFLHDVGQRRVSAAILVPTMILRVLRGVRERQRDIGSLRLLVYGSAPATPRLIRETRAELNVKIVQAYGQTETTGGWMAVLTDEDHCRGLDEKPELLCSAGRIGGRAKAGMNRFDLGGMNTQLATKPACVRCTHGVFDNGRAPDLIHDIKGEKWQLTARWRSMFSYCLLFNPTAIGSAR